MSSPPPLPLLFGRWPLRSRLTPKLIMIGAIIVVMQLPLVMIDSKREERARRHDEAVAEVTATWGGRQQLTGPILVLPYVTHSEDGKPRTRGEIRITPETLQVGGVIEPKVLKRGIYQARVYTGRLKITGSFVSGKWFTTQQHPLWEEVRLVVGITDPRGLRSTQSLRWRGEEVELTGGTGSLGWGAGLSAAVTADAEGPFEFELDLVVDGSGGLEVVPLATDTRVNLESAWPSPSFMGAFLPKDRNVDKEGFSAAWEIGKLGRELPKMWTGSGSNDQAVRVQMEEVSFGVSLLPSVGDYRTIERAIKYGILFFATVFAGFFLFEVTGGRALHGLNYLLVGAAVCLFYLALLALSEFWTFGAAYLTAAGAATGLILLYAKAVLKDGRRLGVMTGILGSIYGYLYLVLQLEDLSLVAGTLLLFGLVGAIMYATRNLGSNVEGAK